MQPDAHRDRWSKCGVRVRWLGRTTRRDGSAIATRRAQEQLRHLNLTCSLCATLFGVQSRRSLEIAVLHSPDLTEPVDRVPDELQSRKMVQNEEL